MTDTERITRLENTLSDTITYLRVHLNATGAQANTSLQPISDSMRDFVSALADETET